MVGRNTWVCKNVRGCKEWKVLQLREDLLIRQQTNYTIPSCTRHTQLSSHNLQQSVIVTLPVIIAICVAVTVGLILLKHPGVCHFVERRVMCQHPDPGLFHTTGWYTADITKITVRPYVTLQHFLYPAVAYQKRELLLFVLNKINCNPVKVPLLQ